MRDSDRSEPPDWRAPPLLIATCGWLGRIPFAPGTFGSLAGLPLSLATGGMAVWLAGRPAASPLPMPEVVIEAAVIAGLFAVAIPISTRASVLLASKDPGPVVIDEAVAVPAVLLVVPPASRSLLVLLAAFVLFRIFDIVKPPPVRQLERLPRGLGIMADDLGAAALAAGCLAVARWQGWL